MQDIHNGFWFATPIVGESNYQKTIDRCYKDSANFKKSDNVYMDVSLMLEDSNPYDNKAVAIKSSHGIVGYLDRKTARKYRKDYENQDGLTVRAKIYPKGKSKNYGIWIDLAYEDASNIGASTIKSSSSVTIPQKKSLKDIFKKWFK